MLFIFLSVQIDILNVGKWNNLEAIAQRVFNAEERIKGRAMRRAFGDAFISRSASITFDKIELVSTAYDSISGKLGQTRRSIRRVETRMELIDSDLAPMLLGVRFCSFVGCP